MKTPLLLISRVRLLPLLILSAVLLFGVKFGEVWNDVSGFRTGITEAQAQAAPSPAKPATPEAAAKPETAPSPPAKENANDLSAMSESEVALLQRLAERREALDQRAKQFETRENLLAAAEKRVEQRIARLKQIETSIEKLIDVFDAQETARISKLVQVYENMKPKDAAAIFNQLDMDVLLLVAKRMQEAKMAEVLGKMTAEAAKKLTIEMARQKKLPENTG